MSDFLHESVAAYGVPRRKMTVDEYYRAAEAGVFDSDERLELIWGEVIELSPQLSRHAAVTTMVAEALRTAFPDSVIRQHSPLSLDDLSEPEPDVVVAKAPLSLYTRKHPGAGDTMLVAEVADSSIRKDREVKSQLYARFGIPEYWIVDLKANRLEIYSDPDAGSESYKTVRTLVPGENVTPHLGNGSAVEVSWLR